MSDIGTARDERIRRKSLGCSSLLVFVASLFLTLGQTAADEPPKIGISADVLTDIDEKGTDLMDVFADLCLNRFPDDDKFSEGIGARAAVALSTDEVTRMLHGDPGNGWNVRTAKGDYKVTIELPPYHACAVRSTYPARPKYQGAFQLLLKMWAANNKIGPLLQTPPQHLTPNGIDVTATIFGVVGPNGKPQQSFMAFQSVYPNGQVEIRFVRQFPPQ